MGQPTYRAGQIRRWIAQQRARRFDAMTDLPAEFRSRLQEHWTILSSKIARESLDGDQTRKLLVELSDGQQIECVLLYDGPRRTVCLSTQVGCGMGCVFCASGIGGVVRNLTTGEIIEQLLHCDSLLAAGERISHIVVMGMGEPLANLEALLPALAWATSKQGLGVSARHVTISTVGLVKKMRELAESGRPYHLAVSLHAPDDFIRREIVPTAEKTPLTDILAAADEFRERTGRQVTFEYVLLGGVNDEPAHAEALSHLMRGRDAMINLIPYNPVSGLGYRTPTPARSRTFADVLRSAGCVVKIRMRRGAGIAAACGQLRRSQMELTTIQGNGSPN
jgi:23S rRNA (adenine2503-C2)-methyltransferase